MIKYIFSQKGNYLLQVLEAYAFVYKCFKTQASFSNLKVLEMKRGMDHKSYFRILSIILFEFLVLVVLEEKFKPIRTIRCVCNTIELQFVLNLGANGYEGRLSSFSHGLGFADGVLCQLNNGIPQLVSSTTCIPLLKTLQLFSYNQIRLAIS